MKIMFMGTPDIAVSFLEELTIDNEVCSVVTQPDKPKGRGKKLAFSPVKEKAIELGIDVLQPEVLKNNAFLEELKKYNPDVIVVVAYGKILPEYILNYPKYGCINVHASLLPKLRGAAPIQWSIINGDKKSGVTIMKMDKGLDTGDMLLKHEIEITDEMTAGDLFEKICIECPKVLCSALSNIDNLKPEKQDDSISTYAPMFTKENTKIDWNKTPLEIINLIRGTNPFPCAYTSYKDKHIKVYKAEKCDGKGCPGEILKSKKELVIACNGGAVKICTLQLEGKKRMEAKELLCGFSFEPGEFLV